MASFFSLWMVSIRVFLFLKTLPLARKQKSWYMCLSILLASLYFLRRRRRTRMRRIHKTLPGILGTSSLTEAGVSTETLGLKSLAGSVARVNNGGLADDETVLDEFADILTRIGHGDFAGFIRIQPDLAFTAIHNRRREALLQLQDDHPPTTRSEKKKPH